MLLTGAARQKGSVIITRIEEIHEQLVAFYPVYGDQGSETRLLYAGNESDTESEGCDQRQVENVKRALARCYAVDLQAQAKLLRERYYRKFIMHFYLPHGRVFVPFKMRKLRVRGDATYGYVALDKIERLLPGAEPSIQLRSGSHLPLYSNIQTARQAHLLATEIAGDLAPAPVDSTHDLINALSILRELFIAPPPSASPRPPRLDRNRSMGLR